MADKTPSIPHLEVEQDGLDVNRAMRTSGRAGPFSLPNNPRCTVDKQTMLAGDGYGQNR
jgi:hypothetical protein